MVASGCGTLGRAPVDATRIDNSKPIDREQVLAAMEATREQLRLSPREPYWSFHLGELYAAVDSTSRAIYHLQVTMDLDPNYAPAVALLSKIYYDAAIHEDAIVLLGDYLARNAGAPDALRAALALHLEAFGDLDRAHAVLAECADDSGEVRATRTFVTLRGDELDSVLETAERALDANSKSAANHNNHGIALLFAGRPDEAKKAFLKALDLNDKLPGALYNMAIVEAFYFFDEDAGRQWFAQYKKYASDDPDDLASLFGDGSTALLNVEKKD